MSQTSLEGTSVGEKPDMDFRSTRDKGQEEMFICKILGPTYQKILYPFISGLLFKMIQKCKEVGFLDKRIKDIINHWVFEPMDGSILAKFGYKCSANPQEDQCNNLLEITDETEFLKYNEEQKISFSQLMGAIYKFTIDDELTALFLNKDEDLQKKFMKNVNAYFSIPSNLTYKEMEDTLTNSESNKKWFHLWVISLLGNDVKNLYHGNLINEENYIRKWDRNLEFNRNNTVSSYKTIKPDDVLSCKNNDITNMLTEKGKPISNIMLGNSYTVPTKDSFWYKLMKKYNKEIIAGPSSSSVLTYQMIFTISKIIEDTPENKLLLLLCILTHYYQYSHSISEVLQQYCPEAQFEEYNLGLNDIEYIKFLIDKHGSDDIKRAGFYRHRSTIYRQPSGTESIAGGKKYRKTRKTHKKILKKSSYRKNGKRKYK